MDYILLCFEEWLMLMEDCCMPSQHSDFLLSAVNASLKESKLSIFKLISQLPESDHFFLRLWFIVIHLLRSDDMDIQMNACAMASIELSDGVRICYFFFRKDF